MHYDDGASCYITRQQFLLPLFPQLHLSVLPRGPFAQLFRSVEDFECDGLLLEKSPRCISHIKIDFFLKRTFAVFIVCARGIRVIYKVIYKVEQSSNTA